MRNPAPPPTCITGWPPQKRSVFSQTLWASDVPPEYNVHNWYYFLCAPQKLLPEIFPEKLFSPPSSELSSGLASYRTTYVPASNVPPVEVIVAGRSDQKSLSAGTNVRKETKMPFRPCVYAVRTCTPSCDLAGMSLINLEKRTRDI